MIKFYIAFILFALLTIYTSNEYIKKQANLMLHKLYLNDILVLESGNGFSIKKNTIALIGDSRVRQWQLHPKLPHTDVSNYGKNGITSSELLQIIKSEHLNSMPEKVIIQIGINDLKVINFFQDKSLIIQQNLFQNIKNIVHFFETAGSKVYLTTIICPSRKLDKWLLFWKENTNEIIQRVNIKLLSLNSDNVTVIDLASSLGCKPALPAKYAKDTLHLNQNGYQIINQQIIKAFQS